MKDCYLIADFKEVQTGIEKFPGLITGQDTAPVCKNSEGEIVDRKEGERCWADDTNDLLVAEINV